MGTLADATRLRLLRMLERHELGVSDLCDIVQLPQSTVSRHLKLLGDEGWTTSHRQGTTNLYRMMLDELDPTQRNLWLLAREQTQDWPTLQQDELRLAQRLQQRRTDSKAFFAGAAAEWDKMRQELYGPSLSHEAILGLVPPQWTIADLGCGTGNLTAELGRHVRQVLGVDNSEEMLDAARRQTAELENVALRRGDLESVPIEDNAVDAALLIVVLTYVPDPMIVLRQMQRVLKPGGHGVVMDVLRHDRDDFRRQMGQQSLGFDPDQLATMLIDAGFENVTCQNVPPEPQAKGPALLLAKGQKAG
jgi:ArsR family transcriptional regulator